MLVGGDFFGDCCPLLSGASLFLLGAESFEVHEAFANLPSCLMAGHSGCPILFVCHVRVVALGELHLLLFHFPNESIVFGRIGGNLPVDLLCEIRLMSVFKTLLLLLSFSVLAVLLVDLPTLGSRYEIRG